jgi:hypothetical protein
MGKIQRTQELDVRWVHENFYTVSQRTLDRADSRRSCWLCGNGFKIGDGMTVVCTDKGNKTVHTRCYRAQGIMA